MAERDSNLGPLDHKFGALTTRPSPRAREIETHKAMYDTTADFLKRREEASGLSPLFVTTSPNDVD